MRQAPEAITRAFLASVDDGELEYQLLNYVLDLQERDPEGVARLPLALQAHYIALAGDGEILNGGFNQLFFNNPSLAFDLPDALRHLDLQAAADLAAHALGRYESVCPGHRAARKAGTVEAFMATYEDMAFEDLDQAYAAMEGEIREGRIAYIRVHPDSFLHPLVAG